MDGEIEANGGGRRNRVAPDGTLHAVVDRGLFWGNRGSLLDSAGNVVRHSRGRGWVVCQLEFRGRSRVQWRPGHLTELYFLDEATALAAGHRPCGECRHPDYLRFRAAWIRAHDLSPISAAAIDRVLHFDRVDSGRHRTYIEGLAALPDGCIVEHHDALWLVRGPFLHRWSFGGYTSAVARGTVDHEVIVRTPRATVDALAAGYSPVMHPTAARL